MENVTMTIEEVKNVLPNIEENDEPFFVEVNGERVYYYSSEGVEIEEEPTYITIK